MYTHTRIYLTKPMNSKHEINEQSELLQSLLLLQKRVRSVAVLLLVLGFLSCLTITGAFYGIFLVVLGLTFYFWTNQDSTLDQKSNVHDVDPGVEQKFEVVNTEQSSEEVVDLKPASFENVLGTKWFALLGSLALVLGIGLFIKYAIDYGWISHSLRLWLGSLFGLLLLLGGVYATQKELYKRWGMTLIGAGIAIIYFMAYAAYHFEEYREVTHVSLSTDIAILSIIVAISMLFALRLNSQVVVAEAFLLGYITSLLSTSFELITLIYLLILSTGLVALMFYKNWKMFGVLGVLVTYGVYVFTTTKGVPNLPLHGFFLSSIFLVFYVQSYLPVAIVEDTDKELTIVGNLINASSFWYLGVSLLSATDIPYHHAIGIFLSLLYFIQAYFSPRKQSALFKDSAIYMSVFFLTAALAQMIEADMLMSIFALETFLAFVFYLRTKQQHWNIASCILAICTTVLVLGNINMYIGLRGHLNMPILVGSIITMAIFYAIHFVRNKIDVQTDLDKLQKHAYGLMGSSLLLLLFYNISNIPHEFMSLIICVILLSGLFLFKNKNEHWNIQTVFLSLILGIKLFFVDISLDNLSTYVEGISHMRAIAFIPAILTYWTLFLGVKRVTDKSAFLLFISEFYASLGFFAGLCFFALELVTYPLWLVIILSSFCIGILLLEVGKLLVFQVQSHFAAIVLAYLVVTKYYFSNNVDVQDPLSVILVLLAPIATAYTLAYIWNKVEDVDLRYTPTNIYLAGGSFFTLLFIVNQFQAYTISVLWSLFALILLIIGFKNSFRILRLHGLAIFCLAIAKVFFVDLNNLEPIYRILSFILLGILLLGVSFMYTKNKEKFKDIL